MAAEFMEFINAVIGEYSKCYITGHSTGAVYANFFAAVLGDRCYGCMPISGWCDIGHPDADTKTLMKIKTPGGSMGANVSMTMKGIYGSGCCGCCFKSLLKNCMFPMLVHKEGVDRGLRAQYRKEFKKMCGGTEELFAEMDQNHFFVISIMDSEYNGYNSGWLALYEIIRFFGSTAKKPRTWVSWMDAGVDVKKNTFETYIIQGDKDGSNSPDTIKTYDHVPNTTVKMMAGHGHITVMMRFPELVAELLEMTGNPQFN